MFRPCLGFISASLILGWTTFAVADEPTPDAVLKSHRLTASGWVYVLDREGTFHSNVLDARSLYHDWSVSRGRVSDQQAQAEAIQELSMGSAQLKQQISQMRREMSNGGYGGRRAAQLRRMQNQEMSMAVNQAQATLGAMTQQLQELQKKVPKPQEKKNAETEANRHRDALRSAFDTLKDEARSIEQAYHELHKLPDVTPALDSISRRDGVKLKLGPSKEFQADLKVVQKIGRELASTGVTVSDRPKPSARRTKKATSTE